MTARRYDLEPLERVYGMDTTSTQHFTRNQHRDDGLTNNQVWAELADVTVPTVKGWRRRGLTADQAEDLADLIGEHPAFVWSTWVDDHCADADLEDRGAA